MDTQEGFEGLQGLHRDLIAVSQAQLRIVERLWVQLDARVDEFGRLLDRTKRNETSRRKLGSDTLQVDEDVYEINKDFRENATQVADILDLDEVESAKLLLDAQETTDLLDRPMITTAVISFQQRRQFLLECLRLTLMLSMDSEVEDDIRGMSREVTGLILGAREGSLRDGPAFIQKCLQAMSDIEDWLQDLGHRVEGAMALGHNISQEMNEIGNFQQQSLMQQHESLSGIIILLAKASYSSAENFSGLLDRMSGLDRWGFLAVHYAPVALAFITHHGSPDGSGSLSEARMLHNKIMDSKDLATWKLRNLQAAVQTWWLAEYSGWYQEQQSGSPIQGVHLEAEAVARSEAFLHALREGAFECTLTMCSQITTVERYNPARSSLISFLLRDAPPLQQDASQGSDWFEVSFMEQLESFVDALITNMPDTLRQFKSEEDDQRKRIYSNLQKAARGGTVGQDFHLERFLVIISFSFDQRTEAAQAFWSDQESNFYGFLQWASKRQSTPCVSAFCEMLQSISKSEEYATSAHQFLLDESVGIPSRLRGHGSLSWSQIISELATFTARIREPPNAKKPYNIYGGKPDADDIDEPESVLMLESYLRLMSHLCSESSIARAWILSQPSPPILDTLFALCSNIIPGPLQACAFMMLKSLTVAKSSETAMSVWTGLDNWASGAYAPASIPRPSKISSPSSWLEQVTLNAITASFDQANEFTSLLQALIDPVQSMTIFNDRLPFPESLGSSYRMSGIEPYIDLVVDKIFTGSIPASEDPFKACILNDNILRLLTTCLGTFHEELLVLASKSPLSVDEAISATDLATYVKLHPFSRVMEWLFNDRVLAALFKSAHVDTEDVVVARPDSATVRCLLRSIEVMNLLFDLQSTYLNVVRPLLTERRSGHRQLVSNTSLASFEDSVALNLQLIVDLGLYSGLGNQKLSVASLKLLGKLASSRRLKVQSGQGPNSVRHANPLISIMQREDDLERIARSLSLAMEMNPRELEQGPLGSDWAIKSVLLEFLVQTLSALPDQPNIAHALLGFACHENHVEVSSDGLFAKGFSLFHAIVHFVAEYPDGHDQNLQLWALSLRQTGAEVLSLLWKSPLTSAIILLELRRYEVLYRLLLRQRPIELNTLWDERASVEADFIFTDSAGAFQQFLWQRNSFYEYANAELRFIAKDGGPSLKARAFSALLGLTVTPEGEQLSNLTIFDLFDFVDIQLPRLAEIPQFHYFAGIDVTAFAQEIYPQAGVKYDTKIIDEMLALRLEELRRTGRMQDANEEQRAVLEAAQISSYVQGANNLSGLRSASECALESWSQLVALTVGICDFESNGMTAFLLQALQILTPKLEVYSLENDPRAIHIAKLLSYLVPAFGRGSLSEQNPHAGEIANDRACQVFRAAIRSVSAPEISTKLRETLYHICYGYLTQVIAKPGPSAGSRQVMHAVKTASAKTLDIMCDDVLGAGHSSRVSALLVLDALCTLATRHKSHSIVESLVRTNFLQILVESIEKMPNELRETDAQDVPLLLTFYETKFSLLLTIAESKAGAAHVIKAGLFHAVRASGLFSVDPDIGIEIDNSEALAKYYRLLLFITRIITSAVVSHGAQNDSILDNGRNFLRENRALIVATFKRQAKIGGVSFDDAGINIEELVELFVLLIASTDYLEFENHIDTPSRRIVGFA